MVIILKGDMCKPTVFPTDKGLALMCYQMVSCPKKRNKGNPDYECIKKVITLNEVKPITTGTIDIPQDAWTEPKDLGFRQTRHYWSSTDTAGVERW